MNSRRQSSFSVAINPNKIWILGGYKYNHPDYLDSTEFITLDGAENSSTLPEAVRFSCAVKFPDNGYVYLIAGKTSSSGNTNNVWVANPSNEYGFSQGPSLMTARDMHAC